MTVSCCEAVTERRLYILPLASQGGEYTTQSASRTAMLLNRQLGVLQLDGVVAEHLFTMEVL